MVLKHRQLKQKQRGFVLILALVLMTVMTLAAVGSMNSSNIELKATANARQHNVAFNAAQSVLEFAVSGASNLDFQKNVTVDQTVDTAIVSASLTNAGTLSGTSVHAGCSVGVGSSMQEGKGLSYNFFEITGTGSNATNTATSIQGQGLRYPAAACE